MALTTQQIIDAAHAQVVTAGFGGLSMRQLAHQLDVQPGALYYHFASKQDLVATLVELILDRAEISTRDPAQAALDLRATLLPIRESAEVVSFVNAFRPSALTSLRALEQMFERRPRADRPGWAARTLINYVLGFVAREQNLADLVRASVVAAPGNDGDSEDEFRFGVNAILRGSDDPEMAVSNPARDGGADGSAP